MKIFAVTGVYHGSIVCAGSKTEAKKIFRKAWDNERILTVKDISHYNLDNL